MSEKLDCSDAGIAETKKEIQRARKSHGMDGAGKGSAPRNMGPKFRENYDAIFRKKRRVDGTR